ncbi:MAG: hypothetical protein CMC96_01820 [Flavobacteriales bacterium]|nr:hypothetical protein [Flavobacteriales bacterium]
MVNESNLNHWLSSSGYLYPRNETELALFEKAYVEYDFKLENKSIDIDSIINGTLKCQTKEISLFDPEEEKDIQELKMAARKGIQSIPKDILDKMKNKHKNGDK